MQIAQVFLNGSAQAALLFDEVEEVFPLSNEAAQYVARLDATAAPPNGSASKKAWVNQVLESNVVPTIWVTNRSAEGARLPTTDHYDSALLNVESRFELPRVAQVLQARCHGTLSLNGPPPPTAPAILPWQNISPTV